MQSPQDVYSMIPLRDENPTRSFPIVTLVLITINILVFVYELSLGPQLLREKIYLYAAVPYSLLHPQNPRIVLTLFSSLFFHASILHVAGNMLYLWVFGNNIEDRLGKIRFVFFYFACGIIATLGHTLINPDSRLPLVGASGAVSGVLGAYLLLYPQAKVLVLLPLIFFWSVVKVRASLFLIFWIIMQFFAGTVTLGQLDTSGKGGVAWFAHIFGFFAGMVLVPVLLVRKRRRQE